MKLVICVHHYFQLYQAPEWLAPRLEQDFPGLRAVSLPSYDDLPREVADADILIAWSLRAGQLVAAPRLRWLHSTMAAVGNVLVPEVVNSEIIVTNSSSVHGPVVAEHALGLILALARQLPRCRDYQREGRWGLEALYFEGVRSRPVGGATLVVVGMGAIGWRVAQLAAAFGMKVIGVRDHPERGAESAEQVVGFHQLDEVLHGADFVVLAAPVTPRTQGLMNAGRLALLPRSAFIVNVSRGALLDEAALVAAINEGRLAGAALDVFAEEPLPAASPLWRTPQVLITPHSAALNEHLWQRQYECICQNLRRFQSGQPLLGVVDKVRGY